MRRTRSIGNSADTTPRISPPMSKRQRLMMEEFQSLSLQHNNNRNPPAKDHDTFVSHVTSDDDDEAMNSSEDEKLTSEQEATRRAMYQLAFGKAQQARSIDPVDEKLEEMIRRSRLQAIASQQRPKDDFDLQTPYSHGSTMPGRACRQRSNSLPRDWDGSMQDGTKDVDMML